MDSTIIHTKFSNYPYSSAAFFGEKPFIIVELLKGEWL
jgi:hypothetical protein